MERVFISHGQQQEDFARALAQHLETHGLEPWLALDEIEPGQMVARAVREAAESCDGAVLVLGSREPSSWVRNEWSVLLEAHWRSTLQKLVAVLIDDAEAPGFLKEAHVIRSPSAPTTWPSAMASVLAALRLDAVADTPDAASREELRERLRALAGSVQALEPGDDDLHLLIRDLRNLLAHTSTAALKPADRAKVLQQLVALNMRLGAPEDAEPLLRETVSLLSRNAPSEQSARAYYNLGIALLSRGDLITAREVLNTALTQSDLVVGPTHPLTAAASYNLGCVLAELGESEDARQRLEKAVRVGMESLGPDHAAVKTYRKALEGLSG